MITDRIRRRRLLHLAAQGRRLDELYDQSTTREDLLAEADDGAPGALLRPDMLELLAEIRRERLVRQKTTRGLERQKR